MSVAAPETFGRGGGEIKSDIYVAASNDNKWVRAPAPTHQCLWISQQIRESKRLDCLLAVKW